MNLIRTSLRSSWIASKLREKRASVGGNLILWLLGVPLPIILLISLLRGCR